MRIDIAPNSLQKEQLEAAWRKFSEDSNERANRLTVSALFLSSCDRIMDQAEQCLLLVSQVYTGEVTADLAFRQYNPTKDQLVHEYQDTNHMGRALLERLATPGEGYMLTIILSIDKVQEKIAPRMVKTMIEVI